MSGSAAGGRADAHISEADFHALYDSLKAESAQGPSDRRGALNNLAPSHRLAAVGEVRSGLTVSLASPIETVPAADNPAPCEHTMTGATKGHIDTEGLNFAADHIALNVHGDADSHIDALCHVMYDGLLYNGVPAGSVTEDGATELSIDIARDGIVGRGVLLDIPRLRGVPWLDPGDHVTYDDLTSAEQAEGLVVGPGDLLLVRVGHHRRRLELGPWDAAAARAGLHPAALTLVAERRVAVLGSDSNNDTAPSLTPAVDFPVHVLAINAMGLHLLDYLRLEELALLCEERGAWAFLCVIAPLRLPTATGSPVNPIAVL